jgi:hypothetical protein
VPLFVVVGNYNKVYYDDNGSDFRAALRLAIDEMITEGVYVDNPITDQTFLYGENSDIDVSNIFIDREGNPITITVEGNSNSEIVSTEINGTTLTITANNASPGTSTITLKGTAGDFSDTDEFVVTVYDPASYNIEDFETADFTKFAWKFSGNTNWMINSSDPFDGTYCIQSENVNDNQSAEIYVSIDYAMAGNISFESRTSSEMNYDYLKFYIDDVEKGKWSGLKEWRYTKFPVTAGTHIFKWSYKKDGTTTAGIDCAWLDDITFEGGVPTSIDNEQLAVSNFQLYQNYPNPFNPNTEITFSLDRSDNVKLSVYNHTGQIVSQLVDGVVQKGIHKVNFNALNLNSGIYFYTLETSENSISRKMMLIK